MYDVDPTDWAQPGTSTIYRRVVSAAHDGAIVIEHFGGGPRYETLSALPREIWFVSVSDGKIAVSRANGDADCVVRTSRELFDGIASGEVNAMAALLRDELTAEGDLELLMLVQRLFPGPPRSGRAGRIEVARDPDFRSS